MQENLQSFTLAEYESIANVDKLHWRPKGL